MASHVRAVVIEADGTFLITEVVNDLDALQRLVGGNLEVVYFDRGVHAYCNDEGKFDGLPVNDLASRVTEELRPGFAPDFMVGTVVFLGTTITGNETHCPTRVWDLVCRVATAAGIPFGGPA